MKLKLNGVEQDYSLTPEQQRLMDETSPRREGFITIFHIGEDLEHGVHVRDFPSDEGTIRVLLVEGFPVWSGIVS